MKKLSLALILSLTSTGAMARWVKVGDNYLFATYVDYATARRSENIATMRELIDLGMEQKVRGARLLSAITRNDFDCKNGKWRLVAATFFSRNMGAGHASYYDKFGSKWQPVEPGSFMEVQWVIACGRGAD